MDDRILLLQIPAAPFHSGNNSLIMVASNWYNLEGKNATLMLPSSKASKQPGALSMSSKMHHPILLLTSGTKT
jgi:hypothetical protein